MQLSFRHRALQSKQQSIVEVGRIVNAVEVTDQGIEKTAQLK
jgi:hypothetical protein